MRLEVLVRFGRGNWLMERDLPPPTTTTATTTEMAMIAPLLKFAELLESPSAPVPAAPRLLLPNPSAVPPSPDCAFAQKLCSSKIAIKTFVDGH